MPAQAPTSRTAEETHAFLELALSRFTQASEAEADQRRKELDDLRFESGEHWDPDLKRQREAEGKPCLTIDLVSGPIRQVTNQQRQARPGIQVRPVGQGADDEKAKTYQSIVRQIERNSDAEVAYTSAGEYQAKMGRGVWIVRNEYADDETMEQVVRIRRIDNPHTVYADPTAIEPDYRDRAWALIIQDYTEADFKLAFPDAEATVDAFGGEGTDEKGWMGGERVRVAEYFYIEEEVRQRLQLVGADGTSRLAWEDELPSTRKRRKGKTVAVPQIPEGETEHARRPVRRTTVKRALITAKEILEENTIPGRYIPIVQIDGERRNIGGAVDLRGMVRMVKDPARMEDYHESAITEALALAKSAPWLVEWSQIAEFKQLWERQGVDNPAYLPYIGTSVDGHLLPPPQRNLQGPDISAMAMASQRAQNHIRHVTGTPDVFQEETRDEKSGKAILARQAQQELGTSNYMGNLARGIRFTGQILLSMIPEVYDTPRILRVTDEQQPGTKQEVVVYAGQERKPQAQQMLTKDRVLFDVTDGRYDVVIQAGRHRDTDRIEAQEMITQAIAAYPPIAQMALPMLFRQSDWEGAAELAEALQPNPKNVPPEIMQRLTQLDKFASEATQTIEELRRQLEDKTQDRASRERMEQLKIEADLQLRQLQEQTRLEIERLKAATAQQAIHLKGDEALRLQDDQQAHEFALRSSEPPAPPNTNGKGE